MKRQSIKILRILFLAPLLAFTSPNFEENAPPSLADHLPLTKSHDPVDGGWLPDLTGLPDKAQIDLLTQQVIDVMKEESDSQCNAIHPHLRLLMFQHFAVYQQIANAHHIYFDDQTAYKWAHLLAMILKESSGDSTNVTEMNGYSISTNEARTDLDHWKNILELTLQNRIKLNHQTNFGLTQTSADRLFSAFHLAQNQSYDTEFLEGHEGALTPGKVHLNTAIAIRRLIWFYQDFAQGRIAQTDKRIHEEDINYPEYVDRYQAGLKTALVYCGTTFMFHKKGQDILYREAGPKLINAMASIAYCKLGNAQTGYGMNEFDEQCYADWVTLCPALNIDIALLTPLSYFQTRDEKPICEETFKRLINKQPSSENGETAN
ncbi:MULTISPECIES: hypothetical protein [Legionella]|uniref:Uncharacterized protein n=1 Tax=Legionella drozanskii LLAP-1 TaxID=1212489 RepID=A0A0W0SVP5_9GAMM|nr:MULTISPECIES: hypothetical protein [Legionella]KTC87479.1 hypothetical protein Ldro_1098 [Legionella drozanskii LLAP-1]PJE08206.1 MAG: hypothetical protein CK430_12775 [Legionella sp.]